MYPHIYTRKGKRITSPEYRSWQMMKNRCLNPNAVDYKYYGAKGITVCKRWLIFENFFKDMGERPDPKASIDRINNIKNYCKSNCKWSSRLEQARNRSNCHKITWCDQTKHSWEWAELFQVKLITIHHYLWRIKNNMMSEQHIQERLDYLHSGGNMQVFRRCQS